MHVNLDMNSSSVIVAVVPLFSVTVSSDPLPLPVDAELSLETLEEGSGETLADSSAELSEAPEDGVSEDGADDVLEDVPLSAERRSVVLICVRFSPPTGNILSMNPLVTALAIPQTAIAIEAVLKTH